MKPKFMAHAAIISKPDEPSAVVAET